MFLSKRRRRGSSVQEGAVNFRVTVLRGADRFTSNIHDFDRPLRRYSVVRLRVAE